MVVAAPAEAATAAGIAAAQFTGGTGQVNSQVQVYHNRGLWSRNMPTPPPPSPAGSDAAAALSSLQSRLDSLQAEFDGINDSLVQPPAAALKEAAARIPVLDGHASSLQARVDAVSVGDDQDLRARRKGLVLASAALSERVQQLPVELAAKVSAMADSHKAAGNEKYKVQDYDAAIRSYVRGGTSNLRSLRCRCSLP